MSRGFGVLKMLRFSANWALEKKKKGCTIVFFLTSGVVHKLREQGWGRGGVIKMFMFVHKEGVGGSTNVHVAFWRATF